MKFYLIDYKPEKRQMIDSSERAFCETLDTTDARCWIEAKRNLGFPLTATQEMLLEKFNVARP